MILSGQGPRSLLGGGGCLKKLKLQKISNLTEYTNSVLEFDILVDPIQIPNIEWDLNDYFYVIFEEAFTFFITIVQTMLRKWNIEMSICSVFISTAQWAVL